MISTAFDGWLAETLEREGSFTLFIILMRQQATTIEPVSSSYLHVIGPDVTWFEFVELCDRSDIAWDRVAVFAGKSVSGGPFADNEAFGRLRVLEGAVIRDRLTVRRGELFDRSGRRLTLRLESS